MATRSAFALIALLVLFDGAAWAREYDAPHAYKGDRPLADTAVLFAEDVDSPEFRMSHVVDVDGMSMVKIWWGAQAHSVRVAPGTHRFMLRAIWDLRGGFQSNSRTEQYIRFEVPDMQPRHIYVVRYRKVGDGAEVSIEDFGERAEYLPTLAIRPRF
jgi:hypothetical protein